MFCDLHSHVIWGIDDGAENFDITKKLIRECVADGIDTIITSPHVTPGKREFKDDAYLEHLEITRAWIAEEGLDLRLYTGAEVLYTSMTERFLQERRLRDLADSRYMLVEFMPDNSLQRITEAMRSIGSAGYTPIIAHVERYDCLNKVDRIWDLKDEFNCLIQVNAHTVTRKQGFFRRRFIEKLLTSGVVDFIATDTHDMPDRHPNMSEAYEVLRNMLGEEEAAALTGGNQRRLLLGEE